MSASGVQVPVRRRSTTELLQQTGNVDALHLHSTPAPRKFVMLVHRSSSAPPSSWVDWLWPVCWPALAIIYLMELNVLQSLYLVVQTVLHVGHIFT